jgi:hypothetical protein
MNMSLVGKDLESVIDIHLKFQRLKPINETCLFKAISNLLLEEFPLFMCRIACGIDKQLRFVTTAIKYSELGCGRWRRTSNSGDSHSLYRSAVSNHWIKHARPEKN